MNTHHSYWLENESQLQGVNSRQRFRPLANNIQTDVAIIGAGITGLSTALELLQRGLRVAVFEALTIGAGTTGASTGHLDAQPERGANDFKGQVGGKEARICTAQRLAAIDAIESRCKQSCGFQRVAAYYYSEEADDKEQLQSDFRAAATLGLSVNWLNSVPFPFAACGYRIENMARINPLEYLHQLSSLVAAAGGKIFEDTKVDFPTIQHPEYFTVGHHVVNFKHLVSAVHSNGTGSLRIHMQVPAYQSYVIAARVSNPPPDALFWDNADPYFYTRRISSEDEKLIMVGGCDHRTGTSDAQHAEETLEDYLRERFDVEKIHGRWSAELFEPTDALPFIGQVSGRDNVWVATGLSGIGLTWGTAAGKIIAEKITGEESLPHPDCSPSRFGLSDLSTMTSEQLTSTLNFAKHLLPAREIDPDSLQPGEGTVGKIDGKHLAICRDREGCEHRISPVCTHMHGLLQWNSVEQTWDCPIHGGRFTADGHRLYGPPTKDLENLDPEPDEDAKKT